MTKSKKPLFPQHVSDFLNLFHSVVFNGSDGEDEWKQYLTIDQKECVSLSLAVYYQCSHCEKHHSKILCKLKKVKCETLIKNVSSMVLFLRTDISRVSESEFSRWLETWDQFSLKMSLKYRDEIVTSLVGLAVGIARDDIAFIKFFGEKVKNHFQNQNIDYRAGIGELISVVVFMKSATSKNRIIDKVENLLGGGGE